MTNVRVDAAQDAYADRLVATALSLACLIRDEGRDGVTASLARLTSDERDALPYVMAALIPDDQPANRLLAWIDPQPSPPPPRGRYTPPAPHRQRPEHGSLPGWVEHHRNGTAPCPPCATAHAGSVARATTPAREDTVA